MGKLPETMSSGLKFRVLDLDYVVSDVEKRTLQTLKMKLKSFLIYLFTNEVVVKMVIYL